MPLQCCVRVKWGLELLIRDGSHESFLQLSSTIITSSQTTHGPTHKLLALAQTVLKLPGLYSQEKFEQVQIWRGRVWESLRVQVSFSLNGSENLNAQQLSSSFGPDFSLQVPLHFVASWVVIARKNVALQSSMKNPLHLWLLRFV